MANKSSHGLVRHLIAHASDDQQQGAVFAVRKIMSAAGHGAGKITSAEGLSVKVKVTFNNQTLLEPVVSMWWKARAWTHSEQRSDRVSLFINEELFY